MRDEEKSVAKCGKRGIGNNDAEHKNREKIHLIQQMAARNHQNENKISHTLNSSDCTPRASSCDPTINIPSEQTSSNLYDTPRRHNTRQNRFPKTFIAVYCPLPFNRFLEVDAITSQIAATPTPTSR